MKFFGIILLLNISVVTYFTISSLNFKTQLKLELSKIKENDPLKNFDRKVEFYKVYSEFEDATKSSEFPVFEETPYLHRFPFLHPYTKALRSIKDPLVLLTKTNIIASSINDEKTITFKDKINLLNKVRTIRDKLIGFKESKRRLARSKAKLKVLHSQFEAHKNATYEAGFKSLEHRFFNYEAIIFIMMVAFFILFIFYAYGTRLLKKRRELGFQGVQQLLNRYSEMVSSDYQLLEWSDVGSFVPMEKKEEFEEKLEKREEFEFGLFSELLVVRPLDKDFYGIRKIDLERENKIKKQVEKDVNDELALMVDHLNHRLKLDISKIKHFDVKYFYSLSGTMKDFDRKISDSEQEKKENTLTKYRFTNSHQ